MPIIMSAGVEIHYEVRGEGPAILFHTGAGGDCRIWELAGYMDALPGFRKIHMDQRGRGMSGRPRDVEAHRMEQCVSDAAAVLDDAGEESARAMPRSQVVRVKGAGHLASFHRSDLTIGHALPFLRRHLGAPVGS